MIRRVPSLLGLLTLSFVFFLLFGPVYVALPLHVADDLNGSAGQLAAFYSAFGIGAVLGSMLTGFLSRWPIWPTLIGIVSGIGVFMLPMGLGAPTAVAVCSFGVAGLLWPPYVSISTRLFQSRAPSAHLSQALAAKSAVAVLSVPLGNALGGALVTTFGPAAILRFSAAAIATLGLVTAVAMSVRPHDRSTLPDRPGDRW